MPSGLLPVATPAAGINALNPQAVVETFLARLAGGDVSGAGVLLADDVVYSNVGLPTIHGRRGVVRALSALGAPPARRSREGRGPRFSFEVYLHAITATGPVVLTERTDVICAGPVRMQFWVAGRFDVQDGQITLWRDAFDYLDCTRAVVRGLLGAIIPALRPSAPTSLDTPPGRH
jgi:limonene-1,2-epoxide hydrolase